MNALYSLYDALVSINVPNDKARAVVDAMERDMTTVLATKSDLALLESRLDGRFTQLESRFDGRFAQIDSRFAQIDGRFARFESRFAQLESATDGRFAQLESKLELLRSSMTVRLGSMLIAGFGLLFAALKLTG